MPCDGIAVLATKPVRIDVVGELSTPAGRKALQAYLEAVGLAVEGVEVALQKVVRVDRVSRAPNGAVVVEARIQGR